MSLLIFYGLLALSAMLATLHDQELRWIGLWLVGGYIASNILFAATPPTEHPGPYTLIEMMVALATFISWGVHRYPALVAIVMLNAASICVNVAFASNFPPSQQQIYLFVVTTNVCFALECVLAAGVGVAHGRRTGRFAGWHSLRWRAAEPNVARKTRP